MKRTRRRNPGGLTFLVLGAVASLGGLAFLLSRKGPVVTLASGVQFDPSDKTRFFVGIDNANFALIEKDMALTVDVVTSGFNFPGVHDGDAIFRVIEAPNLATRTVLAVSQDPRIPEATPRAIPQSAITGLGA